MLSDRWRHRLLQRIPGLATAVLPNAVDTRRYAANGPRGGNRVLFVGELSQSKGIDDLLRAWACLPQNLRTSVRLRVAGDDPQDRRTRLQAFARELGILESVEWLGPLPHDRLIQEYAQADVFVLPSHGEGMPLSLLEAMAAGLPCVVTDVGAVTEVVTADSDALVVGVGDSSALANALSQLLQNAALRRSIGSAARRRAGDFDARGFHPRLNAIWQWAISPETARFQDSPVKNSA
jgi:glycosyltransferase involved in cell wall biosynthesis